MADPHQQLRTLIAERGGPLPALGYRPALPPSKIFKGFSGARLATLTGEAAQYAQAYPALGHSAAASKLEPGALAGSALITSGEQGVPVGAIAGLLAASLNTIFSGRPKNLATEDVGRRLESNPNPVLSRLGAEIVALAQSGHVLSSKSDLQRFFQPAIVQAVNSLVSQGFPKSQISALVRGAVYSQRIAEIPRALPQAIRPPAATTRPVAAGGSFAPRAGFRVIRPPARFGSIAPAEAAAVSTPYEPLTPPVAMIDSQSVLSRYPWLTHLVQTLSIEKAGEAALKLLRHEYLSNAEFGALAGAIIGSFAGQPGLGAAVGVTAGQAVDALQEIAARYLHQPLSSLLSPVSLNAYNVLQRGVSQPGPVPAPQPAMPPPPGPGEPGPLPPFQPQQFIPPPGGEPPTPPIVNQPAPCPSGNCPGQPGQPGDCSTPDSPIGALARQLVNCPTFQDQMQKTFRVTQKPGEPPTLTVPQPLCLCCDSAEDLQVYVSSGGIRGNCIQIAEPQGTLIPSASQPQLGG